MPRPLGRLTRRAEFLRVAGGRRWAMPGFVLQARPRGDGTAGPDGAAEDAVVRVGYTVTRKVGNAVERNRVRRRLRAAAREVMPAGGDPGQDYVLVGRRDALARPFPALIADLAAALTKIREGRGRKAPSRP